MKTILKICATVLLLFALSGLNAQEEKSTRFRAGFGVGLNVSKFRTTILDDRVIDPYTPDIGGQFYGMGVYKLGKNLKINLKPGFTYFRNKGYIRNVNTWLLNIPLSLDVNLGKGFSIETGLDLNVVSDLYYTGDLEDTSYFVISDSDRRKVFLSGQLGVNYMINDEFGINFKCNYMFDSYFRSVSRPKDPSTHYPATTETYIISSHLSIFYLF